MMLASGAGEDAFIGAWNLWWTRVAAAQGDNPLATRWLFHPDGTSLVLHTYSLTYGVASLPLQWIGGLLLHGAADPAAPARLLFVVYNLILIASFTAERVLPLPAGPQPDGPPRGGAARRDPLRLRELPLREHRAPARHRHRVPRARPLGMGSAAAPSVTARAAALHRRVLPVALRLAGVHGLRDPALPRAGRWDAACAGSPAPSGRRATRRRRPRSIFASGAGSAPSPSRCCPEDCSSCPSRSRWSTASRRAARSSTPA